MKIEKVVTYKAFDGAVHGSVDGVKNHLNNVITKQLGEIASLIQSNKQLILCRDTLRDAILTQPVATYSMYTVVKAREQLADIESGVEPERAVLKLAKHIQDLHDIEAYEAEEARGVK